MIPIVKFELLYHRSAVLPILIISMLMILMWGRHGNISIPYFLTVFAVSAILTESAEERRNRFVSLLPVSAYTLGAARVMLVLILGIAANILYFAAHAVIRPSWSVNIVEFLVLMLLLLFIFLLNIVLSDTVERIRSLRRLEIVFDKPIISILLLAIAVGGAVLTGVFQRQYGASGESVFILIAAFIFSLYGIIFLLALCIALAAISIAIYPKRSSYLGSV